MTLDPTSPEGRAELRERHVLATDHGKETLATRHLTHPTIYVDHGDGNEDGLVGALPIWGNRYAELIVAAVNALPALLDALDDAEAALDQVRKYAREQRLTADALHSIGRPYAALPYDNTATAIERIIGDRT